MATAVLALQAAVAIGHRRRDFGILFCRAKRHAEYSDSPAYEWSRTGDNHYSLRISHDHHYYSHSQHPTAPNYTLDVAERGLGIGSDHRNTDHLRRVDGHQHSFSPCDLYDGRHGSVGLLSYPPCIWEAMADCALLKLFKNVVGSLGSLWWRLLSGAPLFSKTAVHTS